MASNTVLRNLVKSLKDEGADIMSLEDAKEKALYFCMEITSLTFAGTTAGTR